MNKRIKNAALMCAALALVAAPAQAAPVASNVYRFTDGSVVAGAWSTLNTGDHGIQMTLHTNGLGAGHTVTIWWVVFNQPQNCTHGHGGLRCGPGDLPIYGGDGSAQPSVIFATGHVIGGSGTADFAAHLAVGDTSGALFGPGITNPTGADIHLIVHDHGVLSPSQVAEGIHHFGPCNPTCADVQFSPHEQ